VLDQQTLIASQARKQALLLESELNRLVLRLETEKLHAAAAEIREAARLGRLLRPQLLALAGLSGLVIAGRFRRRTSGAGRLLSLFRFVPGLYALWRDLIRRTRRAERTTDAASRGA
jgi:hypothetical protein